jgi:hypothetical protein
MKNLRKVSFLVAGILTCCFSVFPQSPGGLQPSQGKNPAKFTQFDSLQLSDPFVLADPVTKPIT